MKGILLISHGPLCQGMYETTKWFLGDSIEQYDYLPLLSDDTPEDFDEKLAAKIQELDSGEGVIIFADLMGGTPSNRSMLQLSENVDVVTGLNLAMVLEQLGGRFSDHYDLDELVTTAQNGIVNLKTLLADNTVTEDDE